MVKMRPDMKDLKAMSPDLDEYWSQYFEGSPDKPLMCLYPLASVHLLAFPPVFLTNI